ncbi:TatD family hydrolase [Aestuariirhabdus litorea]|uniref:TatD family deoxyribonuclease n=1 Tax=Aestuariirhabdus litorea TaxID=2528527 RepID=A0A3P3VNU8_9GAMM|nr:TatD family hydrolase [Aestuariirhabdus litorea]RRJ84290.1 TatD family deoxyribonuclease [Aestuariirhabdus litorea]RWW97513.1 YchF/TatD family DNA exonuclease [Endozoicomonadaceae bacterium GTF-13]
MSKKKPDIPRFNHPIIETHCHLDYLDEGELDELLARSAELGIERMVTIAVSPDNLEKVLKLSRVDSRIWGTQGIHPHDAEQYNIDVEAQIIEQLDDPRMLAVGEIGLDYYYDHADRKVQREVFERQLQIAVDRQLPVVIHSREADEDTQAILANFERSLARKGVIHSFTSGMALARYCLEQGFMLGFNGIATFNRAENVREVVRATPIEQLVLETDSPYLAPVPYRGKPNSPCYLPFIAQRIAEELEVDTEHLLRHAYRNSLALFFPSEVTV